MQETEQAILKGEEGIVFPGETVFSGAFLRCESWRDMDWFPGLEDVPGWTVLAARDPDEEEEEGEDLDFFADDEDEDDDIDDDDDFDDELDEEEEEEDEELDDEEL
jgi:hypothetical protein